MDQSVRATPARPASARPTPTQPPPGIVDVLKLTLFAAAGGAIGAALRFLVGAATTRMFGIGFPWGTLTVNVLGSLGMGLLIGLLATRGGDAALRTFLAIGILGGFTTFSAFSLDVVTLLERRATGAAAGYVAASVTLSVAGLMLGLWLARPDGAR
ncbi:MAG: fluoride efflux transporter CrcB [Pseudomonadota bacterium]